MSCPSRHKFRRPGQPNGYRKRVVLAWSVTALHLHSQRVGRLIVRIANRQRLRKSVSSVPHPAKRNGGVATVLSRLNISNAFSASQLGKFKVSEFYPLAVTGIEKTIRDAVVVTLEPQLDVEFAFIQGQYLTFRRDFDGQEIRRSYSICTGQGDGVLQIGIKRVSGGVFSTWANRELEVGDVVEAMLPMGNFYCKAASDDPHYLAFAGGSGITPVLSILRSGLNENRQGRYTLVYANRNSTTVMFREELEDLKNEHLGRFNVIHVLEDASQEIDLFRGRVDGNKCAALFDSWIDLSSVDMAFICGPEPMMLAISDALKAHGLSKDQIRFELFASNQSGRLPKPVSDVSEMEDGIEGRVIIGGMARTLTIPEHTSLLEAALGNDIEAPYACKAGVCSTCRAKVLEGEVEMIANHSLEDYEVEAGFVLTCQCYPVSAANVVWDYDEAGH